MKKLIRSLFVMSALVGFAHAAHADDGSAAWIAKCKNEIDAAGNPADVVDKWCTCMNGEMEVDEKLSILAWQKTPAGQKADAKCEKESGWK